MTRKIILLVCAWLVFTRIIAQTQMTLQVPPAGILLKNQLWNMLLVSGSEGNQQVIINLSLLDLQSNQVILTGSSSAVTIAKGGTQLTAGDLGAITYTYYLPQSSGDRDPNGMLPVGNYQACYTVSTATHSSTLTENCVTINVDPLSPPLLNSPANETALETPFPQFTWLPPTPVQLFGDLNYDFVLVEVRNGQSFTEAIQNNAPLRTIRSKEAYYAYPASGSSLDTAKIYAWRVIARNGNQHVCSSETWTFSIKGDSLITPKTKGPSFLVLKKTGEPSDVYTITTNSVGLKYYSFDKEHETKVVILNSYGEIVATAKKKIQYGTNYFSLPLGKDFQKENTYTVQVQDLYNNIYSVSFRM